MRRGLLLLAAALLLLPGCHQFWGSSYGSESATATYGPEGDASLAEANVRASIPAIEAYNADHGSYAGMTAEDLRTQYDAGIGDIEIVVATKTAYCVESTAGSATASYRGPAGPLAPVGCDEPPPPQVSEPPPPSYDAQTNVRAAIPAIEAYYADNGTYKGLTIARLRSTYDWGIPDVKIVLARKSTYCVESSAGGETYSKRGPRADIVPGRC